MNSRNEILANIRKTVVPPVELPSLDGPWVQYEEPTQKFASTLTAIGGAAIEVSDLSGIADRLHQIPAFAAAAKIAVAVDGLQIEHQKEVLDLANIEHAQELRGLDFAIVSGQFAVAENGAVWVTDENLRQRAIFVAAEHLALVVSKSEIVSNMHQAYERLEFDHPQFGMFIAGPSKTADIEQSLVIGAQGARSMTVFLVGP